LVTFFSDANGGDKKVQEMIDGTIAPGLKGVMQKLRNSKLVTSPGNVLQNWKKVENLLEEMDNDEDGGAFTSTFYGMVNNATNNEYKHKYKVNNSLKEFMKTEGISPEKFYNTLVKVDGVSKDYTPNARAAILLYSLQGDSGMKYLEKVNGISKSDLELILNSITSQETKLANYLIEELQKEKAALSAAYFKATGKELSLLDKYFPFIFDKNAKQIINFAEELKAAEDRDGKITDEDMKALELLSNIAEVKEGGMNSFVEPFLASMMPASGRIDKSFTKERTGGSTKPLKLDAIGNFRLHEASVAHYLSFIDVLPKLEKLMNDKTIDALFKAKVGEARTRNIKN
jgi:hypothetical protein